MEMNTLSAAGGLITLPPEDARQAETAPWRSSSRPSGTETLRLATREALRVNRVESLAWAALGAAAAAALAFSL